jgi:Flp pilus assembly protein TadG
MRRAQSPQRHPERGVVIIWTAFFLLTMLGFVAIGIDVAKLMATRTQLQNAADAAALAGASALNMTTGVITQDTARVRAQAVAALNKAFVDGPTAIALASGDISFPTPNRVKVVVHRNAASGGSMITHVAQVVGVKSLDMSATAVALAESVGSVCEKLVPLGAIQPPAGGFKTGCANTYVLKLGDGTQGNFQLLDFPECSEGPCAGMNGGGAEIRCEVANGYSCCINIGQMIMTMPGNKTGPFLQGLNDRWDGDSDRRENICYTEYRGNGNRIVIVPMFKDWDPNGKKPVKVEGFSAFFLQKKPNKDLTGQFLYYVAPGGKGGAGGVPTTIYSLRLVQ